MAGVTYLLRAIPFALAKGKIENKTVQSFLHYIPYTVLAAMTVPAVFYETAHIGSGVVGFAVAIIFAWYEKGLVKVAAAACAAVFLAEFAFLFFS